MVHVCVFMRAWKHKALRLGDFVFNCKLEHNTFRI